MAQKAHARSNHADLMLLAAALWIASSAPLAPCQTSPAQPSATASSPCPDTDQTTVIKPQQGSGFYFYRFMGDSSVRYFLDGKKFSLNDKDYPGKTFLFIDDFAFEPLLVDRVSLEKYVKSSKDIDVLRAQAKHQQDYFKGVVPSMVITDYGPSARKNPDGSDDRLFYLWKKESTPGSTPATQYLVSTVIKRGVFVLSFMPSKESVSEDDIFLEIQKYTSSFDLVSSNLCAKVLAAPSAH
jgi:hypothetical protein